MQTIFFFDMLVVVIFTVQKGLYDFGDTVYFTTLGIRISKSKYYMCLTHLKKIKINNFDYKIFINISL